MRNLGHVAADERAHHEVLLDGYSGEEALSFGNE